MVRALIGLLLIAVSAPLAQAIAAGDELDQTDFFESHIRPLLIEKCHSCHAGDKPKGGLSLTSRSSLLTGGDSGPAATPGKPHESLLIDAVKYESEPRMPPKAKLADREIAALTRWIELGLPWPGSSTESLPPTPATLTPSDATNHWAFQPIQSVVPPNVHNRDWVRNPIDAFVLAKLESKGLEPAPHADRRTLIRRAWFDVLGVPPSLEDLEHFAADPAPDAYNRLVDQLLASPQYGQKWARHWLDVARYSDTKGYVYAREEAAWVHAWAYRDWVIRAFNDDLPYNRFLTLQIAADQLGESPADLAAMGFLTLGRRFLGVTHEIVDDRIDVVTRGALGLTVACARCHDHKYDPIPTSDYYALSGVFRNSFEQLVPGFTSTHQTTLDEHMRTELERRQSRLADAMSRAREQAAHTVRTRLTDYLLAQLELHHFPEEGFDQILSENDLIPAFVRRWRDHLASAAEHHDPVFTPWRLLMQLNDEQFAQQAESICKSFQSPAQTYVHPSVALAFSNPPHSRREVAQRYGKLFQEVQHAWELALERARCAGDPPPDRLPDPDDESLRNVLYGPDSPCEVPDESIVNTESFFPTAVCEALWRTQGELDRYLLEIGTAAPHYLILRDRARSTPARVLRRGNPATPGEPVPARFVTLLTQGTPRPFQVGSGRKELAHAIVDPSNPLTARVLVNRIWMNYFGTGLVATPADFGTRAAPPSHPELLDWLAHRCMADGWSVKRLHRLILLSSTYQQASKTLSEPARRLDPDNRLLWHKRPHRLSFEELRDALLATTGELDPSPAARSLPLFAPPFPTRRSIYGLVDRQDLPNVYRTFDFANPDLLIPQRSESTVPQQALFFLNHPFLLERAQALAGHPEITRESDTRNKVAALYRRVLLRNPTRAEIESALLLIHAAQAEPPPSTHPPTAADWQYGYGTIDEESGRVIEFHPLPHATRTAWQGGPSWPDPTLGWVQLTAQGGHAGNNKQHAAIRRWVAPHSTRIRIQSTLAHEHPQGDGVRGFIISTTHHMLQHATVHNQQVELNTNWINVHSGETIDFVVDLRDNLDSDMFLWTPTIEEQSAEPPRKWDAHADFTAAPSHPLNAWEQLAQVLLMSNEFVFID